MAEETNPSKDGIFSQSSFAIVRSDPLGDAVATELIQQIELHGGEVVVDNYPAERLNLESLTHIITTTFDFPDYYDALDLFVQVVKPAWVTASVATDKLAHPRKYSPDPKLFMSDVVATCADLPLGDKDAIAGGILAMGGNYSSKLTSQVTHVVALSMENDKVEQVKRNNLNMTVVLPHWFDDCLKLGKKIDEGPYTLPDPEIMQTPGGKAPLGRPNKHVVGAATSHPDDGTLPSLSGRKSLAVFKKKRILLDEDLKISQTLRNVLNGMILTSNGKVVDNVSEANVLICKYRCGENYTKATAKKIDVGNLAWLYYLIVHDLWTSPYRRLLHYPIPKEPLPGFDGLKISLSNYSGEARTFLENLIIAIGAECTKTLKQENTHLVTAHKKSEKVAAAEDWNIAVVNHLWIEESYAKWEMQNVTNSRYIHFPTKTNLGEVVGQTQIDKKVIEQKFSGQAQHEVDTPLSVRKGQADAKALDASTPAKSNARSASTAKAKAQTTSAQTPATSRVAASGKENLTPGTAGSRKSKDAATAKLHDLSTDIALFEKERKRVGGVVYGGRRKGDEDRVDGGRKRSAEPTEADATDKKQAKRPRTDSTSVQMHLLISGYKGWVGKAKKEDEDIKRLRELGIAVVDHPSKATHLAAPNILRTPKFMAAIAYAPIVLSTDYIEACLNQDEFLDTDGYQLADKANEKKHGVVLKKALENAKANKQQLFSGTTIYCTEKIVGGFETLQAIAEANGTTLTPYRGRHMAIPSRRAGSGADSEDHADNDVYLISNDNEEDRRLWPKFVKMAEESRRTPYLLIAEWLLSSALRQEIQPLSQYRLSLANA
ncbi:regulator of Ty1 Transposition [Knufia fluminis]|uniref:Regulator of Ty1 Transposition n=1 Tax=Knufia fluminis TaxID=191047 RepID=A0AAN8EY43_9EURO|nr:regulator of Ty1 Transposition [Knufia fluminis]